jgi:Fe-S cluster biogenesis protein NfuA
MESYNKEKLYDRQAHIYTESNPNPNSMKFVANFMIVGEGDSFDFPDKASAAKAPLASDLFDFPYVTRVFYMSNFITITKSDDVEWISVRDELKNYIKAHLEAEKPVLNDDSVMQSPTGDSEIEQKIIDTLDEYIRPAVEQDGGAITFHSYNEGVVKVLLQGACSGCPSSTITLKAGIEALLKRAVPEIHTVEAEDA